MEFSQGGTESGRIIDLQATSQADLGRQPDEDEADDLYAEDVNGVLVSVAGVIGLLVLLVVLASLGVSTELLSR